LAGQTGSSATADQSWQTTYAGIVPHEYLASLNEVVRVPIWREWLSRDTLVFVVEIEGELVGFGSAGPIREPMQDYDAELFAIYVLKHAQKRGIGTVLLRSLVDCAQIVKTVRNWRCDAP